MYIDYNKNIDWCRFYLKNRISKGVCPLRTPYRPSTQGVIPNVSSSHRRQVWSAVTTPVTISRLNRLLITHVHCVWCTLEIMWPRNIQNSFWKCLCFSGIWTRHLRRRDRSLYQLGHTTLKIFFLIRLFPTILMKILP